MSALLESGDHFTVASTLRLGFVQEEMVALAEGDLSLDEAARGELAEILVRLLHSFLADRRVVSLGSFAASRRGTPSIKTSSISAWPGHAL